LEIVNQVPDLEAVIVPIGGAGLAAGVAVAVKQLKPSVTLIGVEPERAASFTAALKAGKPVQISMKPTLADGLSVPRVGDNAFSLARERLSKTVLVCEHDLARAVLRLMELEKAVVEGAGAAPLAACLGGLVPELAGKKVVLLLCGGNIDLNTLDRVIERGLAAEEGASVIDITHDRAFADEDISTVAVHCVVETRDAHHISTLRARLVAEGFPLS